MGLFKRRPKQKPAPANGGGVHPPTAVGSASAVAALEAETHALRQRVALLEAGLEEARQAQANNTKRMLLGVIDAIDAFERLFVNIRAKEDQVTPQMKLWIGNFRTILRLLYKVLSNHDAVPIQNLEDGFDPHWHHAFDTNADSGEPEGTILEEIQKGFIWRDQILRKTSVIVAWKSDTGSTPEQSVPAGPAAEAGSNVRTPATDGPPPVADDPGRHSGL